MGRYLRDRARFSILRAAQTRQSSRVGGVFCERFNMWLYIFMGICGWDRDTHNKIPFTNVSYSYSYDRSSDYFQESRGRFWHYWALHLYLDPWGRLSNLYYSCHSGLDLLFHWRSVPRKTGYLIESWITLLPVGVIWVESQGITHILRFSRRRKYSIF